MPQLPSIPHVRGRSRTVPGLVLAVGAVLAASVAVPVLAAPADAAPASSLTRYPYLTDAIQTSTTVNWATDTSATTGTLTWGLAGSSCATNTVTATRTSITVVSKAEYQWKAVMPVAPDTRYCYRVRLGTVDLLGSDASPVFTSQVRAGSTAPFSFAVFGDWGQAYSGGTNPDQTNVLAQMAKSGARFAVMTGDTAYPGGGQKEYGDLQQRGTDLSTVFGPTSWAVPGRSLPVFNVTGNHGFTNGAVQVTNWPEGNAAATSGGTYAMQDYPSRNGSTARSYPSMWYAFDAGGARFYALTAAWADGNNGTATPYQSDRDQHWTTSSPEYRWLAADLAEPENAGKLTFAFWHYPLYADSSGQPSDTFLQGGAGTLQGLLDAHGVAIAFNGHAHGYERNRPDAGGMVSYVLGNGGAALGSVSGCSAFDLYAIGSSGSHCGAAPSGLSKDHVYGFAKVTVDGRSVTVTPTDELGRTYDVQTYTFPATGGGGGSTSTFAPTADATVDSSQPAVALGTSSRLSADASPVVDALLRFTVTGTADCTVTRARLRLTVGTTANDGSAYGGDVYLTTSSTWSEAGVTWDSRPGRGAQLGSLRTAVALGGTYLVDLDPALVHDGTLSLDLGTSSTDGARYVSREAGSSSTAPQLQVTC